MKTTPCPDTRALRDLLDDHLAAGLQAELTGHLDECSSCQGALEKLASGDSRLGECLSHIDQSEPARDSAFWPAVATLDREQSSNSGFSDNPTVLQTPAGAITPASTPPLDPDLGFLDPPTMPGSLGSLGHYDIVRIAGRGGMGMVLKAFDTHLQRDVALKILDPRLANDDIAYERFCREVQVMASMMHENVVAVHSVECEDTGHKLPFLVMQFVDGESLEDLLHREGRLEPLEIVRLGRQITAGLAAVHEKGLVHRDIKPGNILIEKGTGRVKLTDFGLARAEQSVRLTSTGMVAGTPLYMAPEQARGEQVDERSDLFSLGTVLYEMASGESPFLAKTPLAVLKRLTDDTPRDLHDIVPDLPQWQVDVITKLLAKKPENRYKTAREVAEIFEQHYLMVTTSNVVCPKVRRERQLRRRKFAITAAAGVLLAVTSFVAGTIVGAKVVPHWFQPANPSPSLATVMRGNSGPVWSVGFTPDSQHVAMAVDDGTVKFWDVPSGALRSSMSAHKGPVWGMAISPDGKLLATGSDDTTAKIWDVAKRQELHTLPHTGGIRTVAFDPSSEILATGGRTGAVRLWSAATGKPLRETAGHQGIVTALAFSPDGSLLVTGSGDKTVKVWDVATGGERLSLDGHAGGVYAVAFSPKGDKIAVGGWDKIIRIYDVDSGTKLATLEGPMQDIWGLAFSPDGTRLAAGHEDRIVSVWDVALQRNIAILRGHTSTVYTVAFSRDGQWLASSSRDGTIHLWAVERIGK